MRRRAIFIIMLATSLSASVASLAAEVWYQDPLQARQNVAELIEKFYQPDSFKQASRYIGVYLIPMNVFVKVNASLAGSGDEFLTGVFFPYLAKNNIKLAVQTGGARWMQERLRGARFQRDIELLRRLKGLGARVDYLSLQSLLSKRKGVDDYPVNERIDDVVVYAEAIREIYPNVRFGLIDALPSHGKDYQQPYRRLTDALARAGIGLTYIHLDISFEAPFTRRYGISWNSIHEIERYVEDALGLQFGIYAKSRRAGQTSSKMFHRRAIEALECYAGAGGTPRDYIIASWFTYPDKIIPEDATGDDYPLMRTVLEFGRLADQIDRNGPALRPGDGKWQSQCEAKAR